MIKEWSERAKRNRKSIGKIITLIGCLYMAIPLAYLAYWGIHQLGISPVAQFVILLFGGLILMGIGVYLIVASHFIR